MVKRYLPNAGGRHTAHHVRNMYKVKIFQTNTVINCTVQFGHAVMFCSPTYGDPMFSMLALAEEALHGLFIYCNI